MRMHGQQPLIFGAGLVCLLLAFGAGATETQTASDSPGAAFGAGSPWSTTVITQAEIRQFPAYTIPQLLQYVAGLVVITKTRTEMAVGSRGLFQDKSTLLVMLDGQPVNLVTNGSTQWPTLPVAIPNIERIEIIRGPVSALFGADALSGAIHLVTSSLSNRKSQLTALKGSRGTGRYDVEVDHHFFSGLDVAAQVGYLMTENLGDLESEETREVVPNSDIMDWDDIHSAGYGLEIQTRWGRLRHQLAYTWDNGGSNLWSGERQLDLARRKTTLSTTSLTVPVGPDRLVLRSGFRSLYEKDERWEIISYTLDSLTDVAFGTDTDLTYHMTRVAGHTLSIGAHYAYQVASRKNRNPIPYAYYQSDHVFAGSVYDEAILWADRLHLTLAGRYDQWRSLNGVFSAAAGVHLWLIPQTVSARLLAGTSFRRPHFDERLNFVAWPGGGWQKGAQVSARTADGQWVPGETLRPETQRSAEAGVRWTLGTDFDLRAGYFYQENQDAIRLEPVFAAGEIRNRTYRNQDGRLRIHGLEIELGQNFFSHFHWFVNYTGQTGSRRVKGDEAAYQAMPAHHLSGGVIYDGLIRIDLRGRVLSRMVFDEFASPVHLPGYGTVDLAAMKNLGPNFFLKVALLDLLDTRYYEYPLFEKRSFKIVVSGQYVF